MNCETLQSLLNAALDDELSSDEWSEVRSHIAECSSCQEQWCELQALDRELTLALQIPTVDLPVRQLMESINPESASSTRPISTGGPNAAVAVRNGEVRAPHHQGMVLFALVCTLLLAMGSIMVWPSSVAVAEIALATGPVDMKACDSSDWIAVDGKSRVAIPANARIRTRASSLCEIHTKSAAVVRLNQETELVMHRAARVELVAGELWCRASADAGMQICGASTSKPSQLNVFTCPSSTEMQWRALPNHEMSCLDASADPLEIQALELTCTIQPGESLTFASGNPKREGSHRMNPLQAMTWQLPLLALRGPVNAELQERLTGMLAFIGESKASYLYEDQIRSLGSDGAIPLLAFVKSVESREKPELRIRAMRLASEMAPLSALEDLEQLLGDNQPGVRDLAAQGLMRLRSGDRTKAD
jgi:hypothetical protein